MCLWGNCAAQHTLTFGTHTRGRHLVPVHEANMVNITTEILKIYFSKECTNLTAGKNPVALPDPTVHNTCELYCMGCQKMSPSNQYGKPAHEGDSPSKGGLSPSRGFFSLCITIYRRKNQNCKKRQ